MHATLSTKRGSLVVFEDHVMSVGAIISGVGSVVAGLGSIQASRAEGEVLDLNADIARQNAGIAISEGEADVRILKRNQFKMIGAQRAAAFGGGIANLSALNVLEDSISESELDIQRRRHLAELQSRGFTLKADIADFQADTVRTTGALQGASQFLMAGSQAIP